MATSDAVVRAPAAGEPSPGSSAAQAAAGGGGGDGAGSGRCRPAAPTAPGVLYECQCGRCRPLLDLYYCDFCREPVCASGRCTVAEVTSAYCPSCNQKFTWSDAARLLGNLRNVLRARKREDGADAPGATMLFYALLCTYCKWDSSDLQLSASTVKDLSALVLERIAALDASGYYNSVISLYKAEAGKPATGPIAPAHGPWHWQNALNARQARDDAMRDTLHLAGETEEDIVSPVVRSAAMTVDRSCVVADTPVTAGPDGLSMPACFERGVAPQRLVGQQELPTRVHLLTRRSRRCLKCVTTQQSSGIVLMPTRAGGTGGKWFDKRRTGGSVLPRVTVDGYKVQEGYTEVLVTVSNGLDAELLLALGPGPISPSYPDSVEAMSSPVTLPAFDDLSNLVDPPRSALATDNEWVVSRKHHSVQLRLKVYSGDSSRTARCFSLALTLLFNGARPDVTCTVYVCSHME